MQCRDHLRRHLLASHIEIILITSRHFVCWSFLEKNKRKISPNAGAEIDKLSKPIHADTWTGEVRRPGIDWLLLIQPEIRFRDSILSMTRYQWWGRHTATQCYWWARLVVLQPPLQPPLSCYQRGRGCPTQRSLNSFSSSMSCQNSYLNFNESTAGVHPQP